MDIMQNSTAAGADTIKVKIYTCSEEDQLVICVIDNGRGMDKQLLERITDPFVTTRTTRKVGLGIPLLKASAQRASGDLFIVSEKNKGTKLEASFKISHIDRLPLGDIGETVAGIIMANPEIDFELEFGNGKECFTAGTKEIREKLGDVPITQLDVIDWIREFINDGVKSIFGGVLDEVTS